jgi:hypothetical protein
VTPRERLWEEEFAIVLGSEGAYRAADVREMTPEKRAWVLTRIKRAREKRARLPGGAAPEAGPRVPRRR